MTVIDITVAVASIAACVYLVYRAGKKSAGTEKK